MPRTLAAAVALVLAASLEVAAEPVILLHGIWADGRSWGAYAKHLVEGGWEEGCAMQFASGSTIAAWVPVGLRRTPCAASGYRERVFFRVVFLDNDGQSFELQGRQVAAAIAKVRDVTGAARVTLVGHSMGGLAARAYMQSASYAGDVSTLVTVATPHLGSLLPYLAKEPSIGSCRFAAWLLGKDFGAPAVAMLAPDSPEMLALNRPELPLRGLPTDVRYASIVAEYKPTGDDPCYLGFRNWIANWQAAASRLFDPAKASSLATGTVLAHWTDGVVPVVSQTLRSVPVGWAVRVDTKTVDSFHSDVTESRDAWAALDELLPIGSPASATMSVASDAVDLIFCIDTTSSMDDDIDAVKTSASAIIDRINDVSRSARLALVAYRDYGDEYVTKGFPFTTDREAIRRNILSLTVAGGGDAPEAVYEALLHAIHTTDLGAWRDGVKKVVILMGDAPPHTRKHTLAEVVRAAEEVDPAHVFPITVAGSSTATMRAFAELAEKTGGIVGSTRTAAELPREIIKMVSMGARVADAESTAGRVVRVMGDTVEIELEAVGRTRPGAMALVMSRETTGAAIAEGRVVTNEGTRVTAELRALFGTEAVAVGCSARVLRE